MKITGEINLVVYENKREDGTTYRTYVGSICKKHKKEDGEVYIWANVEVVFAMSSLKEITDRPLKLDTNYRIEVLDGFLSFRTYLAKDNKTKTVLQIVITDHKQIKSTEIQKK